MKATASGSYELPLSICLKTRLASQATAHVTLPAEWFGTSEVDVVIKPDELEGNTLLSFKNKPPAGTQREFAVTLHGIDLQAGDSGPAPDSGQISISEPRTLTVRVIPPPEPAPLSKVLPRPVNTGNPPVPPPKIVVQVTQVASGPTPDPEAIAWLKIEATTLNGAAVTIDDPDASESTAVPGKEYELRWQGERKKLSAGEPLYLTVRRMRGAGSAAAGKVVALRFSNRPDYSISPQEFKIRMVRRLEASFESNITRLLEGNVAKLQLGLDPPDTEPGQPAKTCDVKAHVAYRKPADKDWKSWKEARDPRLKILDAQGKEVAEGTDPDGRSFVRLKAPGDFRVALNDDDEMEGPAELQISFAPDRDASFAVPDKPLGLQLEDDESQGDVLVLVIVTGYCRDRICNRTTDASTFKNWFDVADKLGDGHELLGHGVVLVGKPAADSPHPYRIWQPRKTAVKELQDFADTRAMFAGDKEMCLIDCLFQARDVADQLRGLSGKKDSDLKVFVVWPSEERPRDEKPDAAPLKTELSGRRIAPAACGFFMWLSSSDDSVAEEFFQSLPKPSEKPLIDQCFSQFERGPAFLRTPHFAGKEGLLHELQAALKAAQERPR